MALTSLIGDPILVVGQQADFPVVRNDLNILASSAAGWDVAEELRLGTLLGEGPAAFGEIAAIAIDEQGRIYVLDLFAQEVRVFSAGGEYLHSVGGSGQGPGEFQRARGLALSPSGDLWVMDVEAGRWSVFDPNGDLQRTEPRRLRGSLVPWPGGFTNDGLVDWELEWPRSADGRVASRLHLVPVVHASDRVDRMPGLELAGVATREGRPNIQQRSLVLTQDRSGRIWFAKTDAYEVFARDLAGDTLLAFSLPSNPVPVDVDSVIGAYGKAGRTIDRADVHPFKRLVLRIAADDSEGRVYVFPQEQGIRPGTVMDIFEMTGEFICRVDLPTPMDVERKLPIIRGSNIYGIVTDEFDVQYVVRWRLSNDRC